VHVNTKDVGSKRQPYARIESLQGERAESEEGGAHGNKFGLSCGMGRVQIYQLLSGGVGANFKKTKRGKISLRSKLRDLPGGTRVLY